MKELLYKLHQHHQGIDALNDEEKSVLTDYELIDEEGVLTQEGIAILDQFELGE